MTESKRQLRVFLCHASADKPIVRDLYRRLVRDGVDVWMDETNLLPGMDWKLEIPRVVRKADAIIICLSNQSVTKEGYVQKEIRFALDAADEKPDGTIYILPVRLDACEIPSRLARWQWVDLFSSDGYRKLRISLRLRAEAIGVAIPSSNRKLEVENSRVREIQQPLETPKPEGNGINYGFYGRLLAILSTVILACAGLLWSGGRLVNWLIPPPSQTSLPLQTPLPMFTSTIAATSTPVITLPPALPFSPTPFQPIVYPTSTFPPPISTSTFVLPPTQTPPPVYNTVTSLPVPSKPSMSLIPAGPSVIGSSLGYSDEKPIHTAYIDLFYMDQHETTNSEYAYCVSLGICKKQSTSGVPDGYDYASKYVNYPVVNVSWEMAKTYCEWRGARLPTEAEWEKAARGGLKDMLYPWGNTAPTCDNDAVNGAQLKECLASNGKAEGALEVGSFSPNGYQLYDMIGNVSEWVNDWYSPDYYALGAALAPNPQGPSTGTYRVMRGGSWNQSYSGMSVSVRGRNKPETQDHETGFRCARDTAP